MTRRDPAAHLCDIMSACEAVIGLVSGMTLETYVADLRTRSAVERQLEIAAEAVGRLHAACPGEVDGWRTDPRSVAGFRNRLVHEYHALDDAEVFRIAREDVPVLLADARCAAGAEGE